MDTGSLALMLATTLSPLPASEASTPHPPLTRVGEVAKLENAKAWLNQRWTQEARGLEHARACIDQARSWSDIGHCARSQSQRVRLIESLRVGSCSDGENDPGPSGSSGQAAAP